MLNRPRLLLLVVATLLLASSAHTVSAACTNGPVAVQILGSGGPFGTGRASAGYIVWVEGVGRVMVDAGGGTFARFREAGAQISDLDLLALSHFHPDHSSEVPALLWTRSGRLRIAGPSGTAGFPSVTEFVDGLFGPQGVFRVVGGRMELESVTVDTSRPEPTQVLLSENISVRGLGVPHGDVPTVGYRVDVGDVSVAFSSDQNGSDPGFARFARGVDVLVVHFAASEEPVGLTAALHAKPSVWGQMATDAGVGTLVLSHLSHSDPSNPRHTSHSGADFQGNLQHLQTTYDGRLVIAEDMMCVAVE